MFCSIFQFSLRATIACCCVSLVGCSAFGGGGLSDPGAELASIDDVRGPTERRLQTVSYEESAGRAALEDDPALLGAQSLFEEGKYGEAEKAYKTILSRYQPGSLRNSFGNPKKLIKSKTADDRAIEEFGSPIEQECLFMIAECQFAQNNFPKAEEGYQRLLRRYPATRHLDVATKRVYVISRHWLGFAPINISGGPGYDANSGDIQQVVFTDVEQSIDPTVAPKKTGWLNFSDQSKPTFDTTGRALNSLKSIWLNDPTGPLADDALILTANHYYQNGDPVEAGRYYELLREQYPDSPHLKSAYLLESHVKLTSYIGDAYDDKALGQAKELKQASLQIFPDLSEGQRQRLRQEISQIEDAKISREWAMVELYRQKGRPEAVRLYCNSIINDYPQSRYAERSKEMLAILADEERNGGGSLWPFGRTIPKVEPTAKPVAHAPIDLKSRPTPPAANIAGQGSAPAIRTAALEPAKNTKQQNFADIFDASATPSARPAPAVAPAAFEFAETAKSMPSKIRQVSGTDSDENPFAEIMESRNSSTTANKPVFQQLNYEEPAPARNNNAAKKPVVTPEWASSETQAANSDWQAVP